MAPSTASALSLLIYTRSTTFPQTFPPSPTRPHPHLPPTVCFIRGNFVERKLWPIPLPLPQGQLLFMFLQSFAVHTAASAEATAAVLAGPSQLVPSSCSGQRESVALLLLPAIAASVPHTDASIALCRSLTPLLPPLSRSLLAQMWLSDPALLLLQPCMQLILLSPDPLRFRMPLLSPPALC